MPRTRSIHVLWHVPQHDLFLKSDGRSVPNRSSGADVGYTRPQHEAADDYPRIDAL